MLTFSYEYFTFSFFFLSGANILFAVTFNEIKNCLNGLHAAGWDDMMVEKETNFCIKLYFTL